MNYVVVQRTDRSLIYNTVSYNYLIIHLGYFVTLEYSRKMKLVSATFA
jgi:hypothetical protein